MFLHYHAAMSERPRIRITEVGPRDGLQNEARALSTDVKVAFIDLLSASGVAEIEVSSFVSPKWVPQLGDASEVFGRIQRRSGVVYSALVPNEKGLDAALALAMPPDKISVFTAASETFSRKNTNASIAETLERFKPVLAMARDAGLPVRGYVSCVIACPFEGPIAPGEVARVCAQLAELGVDELDLGDTIGAGDAASTRTMLAAVREALAGLSSPGGTSTQQSWWTRERLTLHLHDTFGRAADCVRAALDEGVRSFDSSVAGLGGCPYASTPGKRAPGNIATHKLVNTVRSAGYVCEVDDAALNRAAAFASEVVAKSRQPGQAEQMGQAIASSQPTQPDQSLGGSR